MKGTLLVTTTHRHCKPGEPSGFIYTVDLESKQVTGGCPVIEAKHLDDDPNPRGGMRGAKGIIIHEDTVFIANASVVHRFDSSWNVIGTLSHPSCSYIHDILLRDGSMWVTSCCNDLVFQFDWETGAIQKFYNFRAYPELLKKLGWNPPNLLDRDTVMAGAIDFRDPRTHKSEKFDGGHINSFCFLPNGDMLVLFGLIWTKRYAVQKRLKSFLQKMRVWKPVAFLLKPLVRMSGARKSSRGDLGVALATASSAVVRVPAHGHPEVVLVLPDRRMPTHSLLTQPDGTVYFDDTTAGEIVHLDPNRGELRRWKVTDEFLRGIYQLSATQFAVGSQRDLMFVDMRTGEVQHKTRLSDNPNVSIYDIKLLPASFKPLPEKFFVPEEEKELAVCR